MSLFFLSLDGGIRIVPLPDTLAMATSRPVSLIIPPGIFDENNTSKDKSSDVLEHSSSSSIDSASAQATNSTKRNSNVPTMLINTTPTTTTTATTTDSDFDSEQDDPVQSKKEKTRLNMEERKSRRVKRFHKLFKSEINDDMPDLIDSYVCAYQGKLHRTTLLAAASLSS